MARKLTYWQRRFIQISVAAEKMTDEYLAGMADRYDDLGKSIQKEIDKFVVRYSDESGLSEKEVEKMLSKGEQHTWSMTLKEFRQKAIDGGYDKELNIEYYKSRISRLQKLKAQLNMEFAEFANKEEGHLKSFLTDQYKETYLRNIYELTDRGAFVVPFDKYNSRALRLALSTPWLGSNFSSRIWKNHQKVLPERLSRSLSYAVTQGWGIDRTVKDMMQGFKGFARNRMVTLVQTESAHIIESATLESYRQTGVEKYEWLATLEIHTCDRCGELDGQQFDVDSENPVLPPDHPNCRCTTVPAIEGYQSSKRWMRDPETGKGKVVENMSFNDWKKKHVTPEAEKSLKIVKNQKSDKAQYDKYKAIYGKNAPKSFADFQDLKYNDSEKWEALKAGKQEALNKLDYSKKWDKVFGNSETRGWYKTHVGNIKNVVDLNKSLKEQAIQALELRNTYRTQARSMMSDVAASKKLYADKPNLSLEELLAHKQQRYGLTGDDAYRDIIRSASATNERVNKKYGLE